ncbi:conserved hypothetical protein [Leishmania mexicana MHOM/GT/2001/U1103]|uniref:Uncharacterized protein n=1 Tax=Leishmania mexicana (strain MHOM/GT/2001/U1103) TaxID=929439 RepID=E9AQB9_LEIMU|nr:conserved hypothetical protein [Leishmania mexicana MHOM/GT/2001/U1103]CBZ25138.1 conserved hypothetical protein [Leishmania mexicana MHOM/GT/2001/U1103]
MPSSSSLLRPSPIRRAAVAVMTRALRTASTNISSRARVTTANAAGDNGANVLRPPYPTEGGSVPVYSMMHGQIDKRNWVFRNPQWCELCNEPVSRWLDHQSRKDHALLDLHYSQLAEWPRRWNPEAVLSTFMEHLGIDSVEPYHALFSKLDSEGRTELYAILVKLEEAGMVHFGSSRDTYLSRMVGGLRGLDHQGALVLHECLMGPFLRLFPNGLIQDYSNLLDFISCGYNMETVYDMCGMYTLDKVALREHYGPSSPAAMGLGGIATCSSASRGYENDMLASLSTTSSSLSSSSASDSVADAASAPGGGSGTKTRLAQLQAARAAKLQEKSEEEAFSRKTAFVRQLLGQLRWLLLPEQEHPAGFTFPPHIITLGELCLKGLVVAIIEARLCEYMVRAEPVWVSFGLERRKLKQSAIADADDVVPQPVQYSYRPMARDLSDLYSTQPSALDAMVQAGLQKKKLPTLKAFGKYEASSTHAKPVKGAAAAEASPREGPSSVSAPPAARRPLQPIIIGKPPQRKEAQDQEGACRGGERRGSVEAGEG